MRRELLDKNIEDIEVFKRNNPLAEFETNKFSVMTQEEKKSFLKRGYISEPFPSASKLEFNNTKERRDNNYGYPNYFNWVDRGAVLKPLDQDRCGGCWAFSTASLLESTLLIAGKDVEHLSPQQFIDCDNSKYNVLYKDAGCNGGNMAHTKNYLSRESKFALLSEYPFISANGDDGYDCKVILQIL